MGGFAHRLNDNRDGAHPYVEVCNSKRNSFSMLVDTSHDEMSGPCRPRHVRRVHVPEKGSGAELLSMSDEKHNTPWKEHNSRK